MNTRDPSSSNNSEGSGEASGKHQGLRQPADDQDVEQKLDDVSLEGRGEIVEDELRNRGSNGTPSTEDVRSDDLEPRAPR